MSDGQGTDLSEWPAPWDPLDCRGRMWGIFSAEGYSADPIALFSREQDAVDWMTWQESRGDDCVLGNCDFTICPVDALTGQAWNSHDSPPSWRGAS